MSQDTPRDQVPQSELATRNVEADARIEREAEVGNLQANFLMAPNNPSGTRELHPAQHAVVGFKTFNPRTGYPAPPSEKYQTHQQDYRLVNAYHLARAQGVPYPMQPVFAGGFAQSNVNAYSREEQANFLNAGNSGTLPQNQLHGGLGGAAYTPRSPAPYGHETSYDPDGLRAQVALLAGQLERLMKAQHFPTPMGYHPQANLPDAGAQTAQGGMNTPMDIV